VATTNRDLEEAVRAGTFRQDLFYRLNVVPLRLPPLRERRGDIFLLAEYFLEKYATMYNKPVKPLAGPARQCFLAHSWPGNVREMENLVERAVLLSTGSHLECWDFWEDEEPPVLAPDVLCSPATPAAAGVGLTTVPLKEVERQMILQALQKTDNNRTHAAGLLGISVRTLRNKLHEYRSQGILE